MRFVRWHRICKSIYTTNYTGDELEKIVIIGAGFSSLSAACYMAKAGYEVSVFEKNRTAGGRARQFRRDGFSFDMGPTFYWMPDIFESFFADFGKTAADFYTIERLDPGYEICFGPDQRLRESADLETLKRTFDAIEEGSGAFLEKFLDKGRFNYRVAIDKVIYKAGDSPLELVMPETALRVPQFLSSLSRTVRRGVSDERLRQMLEFPVLFLGAKANKTPSFYRFMNYADMVLGSWHVGGGMIRVIDGMKSLAESLGAKIYTDAPVTAIAASKGRATGVTVGGEFIPADVVISGADYHHTETLLPQKERNYSQKYWDRKVFAPSAILYYIGFDRPVENVSHHTLFFDTSFDDHAECIYGKPGWPEKPLFYASFPSKTDPALAPQGKEAAVILIPTAAGLPDTPEIREKYFEQVLGRMERMTGQELRSHVLFSESFASTDFIRDYNACKGNAYGLANILAQTAFLKPKIRNRRLANLFYTGQLTVPGPGVPTSIISGKIAAGCAISQISQNKHKTI